MQRFFDQDLKALKEQILAMGASVEQAIELAVKGLIERNPELLVQVQELEKQIHLTNRKIDEACMQVLARQAPLARDLRLVLAIIKINADLKSMSRQAANMARSAKHYLKGSPLKPLIDLPQMAELTRSMVRQSLSALVKTDVALSQTVMAMDDSVDELKNKIVAELTEMMKQDSEAVDRAVNLIMVARNLERMGDHATNIAEGVVFIASGVDIRHGSQQSVS